MTCPRVAPTTRRRPISWRRSATAVSIVLATASTAMTSATEPLPTTSPFITASARSICAAASPGDRTDTCSSRSRMRRATASGSSLSFQKTAAAVASGRRWAPGSMASPRST